jgi:hypothetical protein
MIKPKDSIRRFDVFAEYSRQEAIKDGMEPAEAKGYGIWLAKVVAAHRYGKSSAKSTPKDGEQPSNRKESSPHMRSTKWRALDGVPQTDTLFEKEIVQRMGGEFYEKVLVPAIGRAIQEGETYVAIRDKIRKDWKP